MSKFSLHIGLGTTRHETIGFVPCPQVPRQKSYSLMLNSYLNDCKDKFNVHHHLFRAKTFRKPKNLFIFAVAKQSSE